MKVRCLYCNAGMYESIPDRFVCVICNAFIKIESLDESRETLEEHKKRSAIEMTKAKESLDRGDFSYAHREI